MSQEPSPRRVRAVAQDVPDRFDDVDDQLIRDYPELQAIFDRLADDVNAEPAFDGELAELIAQQKVAGR